MLIHQTYHYFSHIFQNCLKAVGTTDPDSYNQFYLSLEQFTSLKNIIKQIHFQKRYDNKNNNFYK